MARIQLRGVWLHDPADPAGSCYRFRYNGDGASETSTIEAVTTRTVGRRRPVVDFGDAVTEQVQVVISCDEDTDDLVTLRALVARRRLLCYRDGKGRKLYGLARLTGIKDEFWGGTATLTIESLDDERNDFP